MSLLMRAFVAILLVVLAAGLAAAQGIPPDVKTAAGTLVYVPGAPMDNPDGAAVYQNRCAVCHGAAGEGNGRATRLLTVPVPDLTLIIVRDGRYDPSHVIEHIMNISRSRTDPMPNWHGVLQLRGDGGSTGNSLIVHNLAHYIETLQVRR